MTSSTLLADPPSNETIDVFYIKIYYCSYDDDDDDDDDDDNDNNNNVT